ARSWGGWAMSEHAWAEATEAYATAATALHALVGTQLRREHQEQWLVEVQSLPDQVAGASARAGDAQSAVILLERSRALILANQLECDPAHLDGLIDLGRTDLVDRYSAATAAWRDLQAGLTAGSCW
ncbi:hypothetical protein ACFQ1S_05740, partial [Kibdelosporangium lantanae]